MAKGSFCRIIHLTVILEYYILWQLADSARNADATEFMQLIEQTEDMLETNRRNKCIAGGHVSNGLLDIYDLENLVVVGDLHGDSKSLFRILCKIDYRQFLSKRLNKLVFLGDYIDRGTDSIGTVYSVCYLKTSYPDSVILMR